MVVELTARYRRNGPVYGAGERIALPDTEARDLIARGGARAIPHPSDAIPVMPVPNKMIGGSGKQTQAHPDVRVKRK